MATEWWNQAFHSLLLILCQCCHLATAGRRDSVWLLMLCTRPYAVVCIIWPSPIWPIDYQPGLFSSWNSRPNPFYWHFTLDFVYHFPSQKFQIIMEGTDITYESSQMAVDLGKLKLPIVTRVFKILISECHLRSVGPGMACALCIGLLCTLQIRVCKSSSSSLSSSSSSSSLLILAALVVILIRI